MVADLPPWQFDAVAEFAEALKFKKGTRLVERGTDDGFTYFLTAGTVSLEDADGPQMVMDADTDATHAPIANLRPRIVDVRATARVQALRIPDIVLHLPAGEGTGPSTEPADRDLESAEKRRESEAQFVFQLYRDLLNNESSLLPSLPETAVRIQLAIEDELSGAEQVARLALTDPAIASKLVMTANSALYGGLTPVDTCTAAVVRLGMQTTRQLVLTFALKEVFRTRDKALRQRMKTLWEHSVDIAAICFVLARRVEGINPEEALLAGLVHDVGTIVLINYANRDPQLFPDADAFERAIARYRGELGALVLRSWNFAPAVVASARAAESWLRGHEGPADLTDILIVAQAHERLRQNLLAEMPPVDEIPAFARVLGDDASPQASLAILHKAQLLAEEIRSVLRR